MKVIFINKSKVLLDDEDFDWLNDLKGWKITNQGRVQLVKRGKGKIKTWLMSRLIMRPPREKVVDHINGNPLDNQRHNLRICTQQQNLWNFRPKKGNVVVKKYKDKEYFGVLIQRKYWGGFKTREEALVFAEAKRKEMFGEFARV